MRRADAPVKSFLHVSCADAQMDRYAPECILMQSAVHGYAGLPGQLALSAVPLGQVP